MSTAKRAAGLAGAARVEDGMRLGLGTGSTTAAFMAALGRRIQEEGLRVVGTPTSFAAERLARRHGIPLATLDDLESLDLAFDGADEIDPALNLIKGRGAAHTREKVVASLAEQFVVLADPSKLVDRLGTTVPVPVEVLPMAATPVLRRLENLGATPILRQAVHKDGPVVSDQGFWIIDARFEGIDDPAALDDALRGIPGVLDHGLFLGMARLALIGQEDGTVRELRAG
jgi:ribose 5-phosphate isomerase A